MKTAIYLQKDVVVYTEQEIEIVISLMRSANLSGSCVMSAYLDTSGTNKVFININKILYITAYTAE